MIGGFVGRALGLYGEGEAAGFVMSFLGAVILLALYRMMVGRRIHGAALTCAVCARHEAQGTMHKVHAAGRSDRLLALM